ncbi:ADP-ribosylation factor-like protein 6-interacting protein 1 [Teleopsis dalmanni]|uniref:ADP-ribosylation factor-like protein 6-interacting protein 1 n=1 Tax=Teleopsis dalmanni TaxID=139649 RepID=UPI0018CE9F4F|nr:ADP-ribosylation factor-like protein 6-interacting protein 1 [Teleopsis dalmanni]
MSQVEQKRAFNKLKHDLEPWRNIIVILDSILTWEKTFYPATIFGAVSILFITLWFLDLSIVTMLALLGLLTFGFDSFYPFISKFLFSPDNWDGKQEARFERACNEICSIKMSIQNCYEFLFIAKERRSTAYAIILSIALLALAWIGAVINNLLLVYTLVLILTLYPGIREKAVFNNVKEKFGDVVSTKIQQISDKVMKNE